MRVLFALPLLIAAGACNIQNDAGNDQLTVEYNEQRIRDTAREATRTAKEVGRSVGNIAETTGRAIKNEVGDVDVDVKVRREPLENRQ